MITYEQALSIVLEHTYALDTESHVLDDLLGGVLSESVCAPHDLPLFDNSSVDGFGVHIEDVERASNQQFISLNNAGTIQAGDAGDLSLFAGSAIKLLTGAPVPNGVNAVIMQEFTHSENGSVTLQKAIKPGENIRRRGEEFQQGQKVLPANVQITPPVIGLLASLGLISARVYRRPKVAIVVTGNELISPGQTLAPGQIYESNSYSLAAALRALGCEPITVHCVADSLPATKEALANALAQADILITSGGVSVGEFDWVKEAAESLGVQTHFWKVAIKPGKPVFFGSQGQKLIFGLPGNPVAVLLTFYLFVQPALQKMQGLEGGGPKQLLKARLLKDLSKKPERLDFVRGKLGRDAEGLTVMPSVGQGSHMLGGLAQADCLLPFAQEASALSAGTWVDVIPLKWSQF